MKRKDLPNTQEVQVAIAIIKAYLNSINDLTIEGIREIMHINSGDKEVIKEHVEAIKNIMEKAYKDLGGKNEKKNN